MSRFAKSARAQRGVALVIALVVVALAVVLIAALLDRGELTAARTRNQLRSAQALAYAQGLEAYAARVLQQAQAMGGSYDTSSSPWAVPLPPTKVPGGEIAGTMRDRNGCFNLNNLVDDNGGVDAVWQTIFRRLLQALKLDPALADVVTHWMQTAITPDDPFYLQQPVPYRPAKRRMAHVSELRLVKGVSAEIYRRLAPEVCALPGGTTINVNTASVAVLMAMSDAIDEQTAKAIYQDGHANFTSISQLSQQLPTQSQQVIPKCRNASLCYGIASNYFLARAEVTLDGLSFTWFSLIERGDGTPGTNGGGIRVIERSSGVDL